MYSGMQINIQSVLINETYRLLSCEGYPINGKTSTSSPAGEKAFLNSKRNSNAATSPITQYKF